MHGNFEFSGWLKWMERDLVLLLHEARSCMAILSFLGGCKWMERDLVLLLHEARPCMANLSVLGG